MNSTIPKRLFFIWFGDKLPDYGRYSVDAFADYNPDYEIVQVIRTKDRLNQICLKGDYSHDIVDFCIHNAYQSLIGKDDFYKPYVDFQKAYYGTHIKRPVILSDIVRLELLNVIGGIYLDYDCIPMKPFDDELLSLRRFCVTRHYLDEIPRPDNYFLGSVPYKSVFPFTNPTDRYNYISALPQTFYGWNSDVSFNACRTAFKKNCFDRKKLNEKFGQFYITHFCADTWGRNSI